MPLHGSPWPDYRAVFDASPGNYLLLDPAFTIVGVTDAYLTATMTIRDQILGRGLFEVFPDNPNDPNADGVRNLRASLLRVLASKGPDRMAVQKYDIRRPEHEGGGFEERYWSPLNTPVLDADGHVEYVIHWVEDVTEFIRLKQEMQREQAILAEELGARASKIEAETFLRLEAVKANRELKESERRYRFLADTIPQLIWTADSAGLVDYCNERWVGFTGVSLDRLRGAGWHGTLHPDERDRIVAAWLEAVRTAATRFQVEHRMRHHDGSWRWMLTTALPDRDPTGSVRKWFGTTTDIHDRVQADEQLRQAQRLQAVGQLAGGMAHEVSNMMSAVIGFGELVLKGLDRDDARAADVKEMIKAGARAAEVTRQLLAFSRQQVLKPTVVDVNAVVSDLTATLERLVGSDRRLEVIPARAQVRVVIDRNQLEQVLINLVANARDATMSGGLITVHTDAVELDPAALRAYHENEAQPGSFTRVAVRDNGRGMAPDVLRRVFEPFFTTKPVGQGTGLGLSMVDGIVRQSGGFTRIDSVPSAGTAAAIYLPRVDTQVTQRPTATAAPRGRGEAVLVVEDEQVVASLARRVLEMQGYTVYQAPNGVAALQFLAGHPGTIELVLTDIVMPRMNGCELAENIRELEPGLPVLFMSGYSGDEIRQRGLSTTSVPFLPKPITPRALAIAVRERLDQARQAHEEKTKVQ